MIVYIYQKDGKKQLKKTNFPNIMFYVYKLGNALSFLFEQKQTKIIPKILVNTKSDNDYILLYNYIDVVI